MPLNPPPIQEANILLVKQQLIRSDMSRAAELEYALLCADSTLATYQDAIDDFQTNFNATLLTHIDTEVTALPPAGRGGDGTDVPILVFAAGAASPGTRAGEFAPPNVALLVRKRTALGGKKNRGRSYIPFILAVSEATENGAVAPGSIAALQGACTTFLAQLTTDVTPMVIENKTFNTPLPPHHVTFIGGSNAQVTSYVVEPIIATQRRRLNR